MGNNLTECISRRPGLVILYVSNQMSCDDDLLSRVTDKVAGFANPSP